MTTATLNCPNCAKKLRIPIDRTILATCPFCNDKFHVDHGKINGQRAAPAQAPGGHPDPWYTRPVAWIAGIFLVFLALMIYNIFFAESRAYARFQEHPTVANGEQYIRQYRGTPRADTVQMRVEGLRLDNKIKQMESSCERGYCSCLTDWERKNFAERLSAEDAERARAAHEACSYQLAVQGKSVAHLEKFARNFPNSKYLAEIQQLRAQSLANALTAYDAKHPNATTEGQQFFRAALEVMVDNQAPQIGVVFASSRELKDWQDYSAEEIELTDQIFQINNAIEQTDYPAPSARPPGSIKNFMTNNASQLEEGLIKSIRQRMDELFGENILTVSRITGSDATDHPGPVIYVTYNIKTLEEEGPGGHFPSLYVWSTTPMNAAGLPQKLSREERIQFRELYRTGGNEVKQELLRLYPDLLTLDPADIPEDSQRDRVFKSYLLATSIDWELRMTYPGASSNYSYESSTRPRANISQVTNMNDAYRRMLETSFDNFALDFLGRFGVESAPETEAES